MTTDDALAIEAWLQTQVAHRLKRYNANPTRSTKQRLRAAEKALENHLKGDTVTDRPKGIYAKLFEIQKKAGSVPENGKHKQYDYVTREDILETIAPLCEEFGVYHFVNVVSATISPTHSSVEVELVLVDAETGDKHTVTAYGYGDNGNKGVFSAQTGACKYVYLQAFGLKRGADEPEIDRVEGPTKTTRSKPKAVPPTPSGPPPDRLGVDLQLRRNEIYGEIKAIFETYNLTRQDFATSIPAIANAENATISELEEALQELWKVVGPMAEQQELDTQFKAKVGAA